MHPAKKAKTDDDAPSPTPPAGKHGEAFDADVARAQFAAFVEFVERHGPFDVVIDGANVGYYGLSSWENSAESIPPAVVEPCPSLPQPGCLATSVPSSVAQVTQVSSSPQPVEKGVPPVEQPVGTLSTSTTKASAPTSSSSCPKSTKQRPSTPLREARAALTQCIKQSDADHAVELFLTYLTEQPQPPTVDLVANVLHLCAALRRTADGFRVHRAYQEDGRGHKPAYNERCYAALLKLHCSAGTETDVDEAIALLDLMRRSGIPLKNRSYHPVFECCEALNSVSKVMLVHQHARSVGLELREAELAFVIRMCVAHREFGPLHRVLCEMKQSLPFASLETFAMLEQTFTPNNGLFSARVTVDESGRCPACSSQLLVEDISLEERDQMLQDLSRLVTQPRSRTGSKTATIAPRYEFIDAALQEVRQRGARALIVLHSRHLKPERVPEEARPIVERWRAEGAVYATPFLMNDDYFWLHAALWSTHRAQGFVVSNDQMRDHLFQLLSPTILPRWRAAHRVNLYSVGPSPTGQLTAPRLRFPPRYTTCIQGLPCTAAAPQAPTLRWHFPGEPAPDRSVTWLCAGPPPGTPTAAPADPPAP